MLHSAILNFSDHNENHFWNHKHLDTIFIVLLLNVLWCSRESTGKVAATTVSIGPEGCWRTRKRVIIIRRRTR